MKLLKFWAVEAERTPLDPPLMALLFLHNLIVRWRWNCIRWHQRCRSHVSAEIKCGFDSIQTDTNASKMEVMRIHVALHHTGMNQTWSRNTSVSVSVKVHYVCLRFCLHLSLSLNRRIAIQQKNSHQITIYQIWKSWSNG